ncbi:MAG: 30S ribosomal protein S20 [bacterium]
MANLASSKKAIRQTKTKTARNTKKLGKLDTLVKKTLKLITLGEKKLAIQQLKSTYKAIDKAAKTKIVHPNKAARMKSNLAKKINNIEKDVKTAPKNS